MFSLSLWLCFFSIFVATTYPKTSHDAEWKVSIVDNEETLILTHVLFRHGNRTADRHTELYPKDPYLHETYHPYGHGQLTNAGKRKEFSIGTSLRKRYKGFLGDQYYPEIIEAITTDYNRTKMSLQLVLAGLFPPERETMWEENLYWQPVPYNYLPKHQDKEVSASAKMQAEFNKHKEVFDYISEHTGLSVTRFFDVYNLYFGISTEEEWGFILPNWTTSVWPEALTSLAIRDYFVSMATADMRKMATGYFLNKIIDDTKTKILSSQKPGRKIHLYSAHENNIAELLISLGIFEPHVPNYGAYVLLEIHRIDNIYGVKIFYENHTGDGPQLLKMPNCNSFCPLDIFITQVQEYIPSENLCGIS
ncbi:hypothetical protein NQ314_007443 [Rhamnusium bicolor]|uniref:acid phosphatase n=1 Tax=Rhamnusium bicolor TaxID=1586634 RepID=A0AAV8YNK2_9CUCU|nr:hypothetical protein NQ314_007443 [Rhamnusium bicolor]